MTSPGRPMRCGPYELLDELGKGGAGVVFRARDPELGREVALKILATEVDPKRVKRFEREAQVVASVDDPGLVRVYASGLVGRRPWIAYELIEGPTLQAELPGLDRFERLERVIEVARILGRLHERGLVHRDVKPENVLTDERGAVRVIDLGIVAGGELSRITESQALAGTPHYMSPEQVSGEPITPAADVWALGVILYQVLTDTLPFEGESLWEVLARITNSSFRAPRQLDALIPRSVQAVCQRALRRDPTRRYADGEAFAFDLELAVSGGSRGPSRWWWVAAAAGVLLTAGLTIAVMERTLGAPPETPQPSLSDGPSPEEDYRAALQLQKEGAGLEALARLERAAEAGHVASMRALGELVALGTSRADKAAARRWFRAAAEAGEVEAAFSLANLLSRSGDQDGARRWYRRAAEAGHVQAMGNLGIYLVQGKGGPVDVVGGITWAKRSAQAGRSKAMRFLADLYFSGKRVAKDEAEAARWYERAAEAGDPAGMYGYGVCLTDGLGVPQDLAKGLRWHRRAVDLGEARSMTALGLAYFMGRGVEQSDAEAVRWYQLGATAGHGLAMLNLGAARMEGRGIERNQSLGAEWFQRAVDAGGAPRAYLALGMSYEQGRGVKVDPARARAVYLQGAEAGSMQCMLKAGAALERGWAGARDLPAAARWYRKAAKRMALDPGEDPAAMIRFWRRAASLGDPEALAAPRPPSSQ